jgi:RNA-binding protein 5/10
MYSPASSIPLLGSVSKDHRKMASVPVSNKRMSEHISRWNAQQFRSQEADPVDSNTAADPVTEHDRDEETAFDYTDETRKACLLCQRQFKTLDVLRRHASESDLHQKNLADGVACQAGRRRKEVGTTEQSIKPQMMRPAGFAPVQESTKADDAEASATGYRDRAQERRIVFGTERNWKPAQAKRKAPEAPEKKIHGDGQSTFVASSSLGSNLLAKMGWTSGQGLGREGEGRVEPVEARVLVSGAGLGSHPLSSIPMTVEEHSARHTRFVLGSAAEQRADRMHDRLNESRD